MNYVNNVRFSSESVCCFFTRVLYAYKFCYQRIYMGVNGIFSTFQNNETQVR